MSTKKTNSEYQPHWKPLILLLKSEAEKHGISNYRIAKETGYSESTIGRIFKLDFTPGLQVFLDIAQVLDIAIFDDEILEKLKQYNNG